jgi:hypothetical protein
MYYPLVYILFYIKKSDAVSPEIGLQVQVNDRISQLLTDDHNNEQNQDDVVSSNDQQDIWYMKMSFKLMEPTFAIKVFPKKTLELPTLIAHMTITMQTSIPEHNKRIIQSSMLMMMVQMQMVIMY